MKSGQINLSLVRHPFDEIEHRAEITAAVRECAIYGIMKSEGLKLLPISRKRNDPVHLIRICIVPTELSQDKELLHRNGVTPYVLKLRELMENCDQDRLNAATMHLFIYKKKMDCVLCACKLHISEASTFVNHAIGQKHVENMLELGLVYPIKELAFWMLALRITEKNALWYLEEKEKETKKKEENNKKTQQKVIKNEKGSESIRADAEVCDKFEECAIPSNPSVPSTPILTIDLSQVPHPFHEFDHPTEFTDELRERTAIGRILKAKAHKLNPRHGIYPLEILCTFPAELSQVDDKITPYVRKLRQLMANCDERRLDAATMHLFEEKKMECTLCPCILRISEASVFVNHIKGKTHIEKMLERGLVYNIEQLAFWMLALRITEKSALWYPEVKTQKKEPQQLKSADVGDECVVESRIQANSPLALFFHHKDVPNRCKNLRMVTTYMFRKLCASDKKRLNESKTIQKAIRNGLNSETMIRCAVCPTSESIFLDNTDQLVAHIVCIEHVNSILSKGGKVDADALFFWLDALSCASKDRKEAAAPPRSPLCRLLVAGMVDPQSPLALLTRCFDVHRPCPDYAEARSKLAMKMRKCNVNLLNEVHRTNFGEVLHCGICIEYAPIRNAADFISHVTTQEHATNSQARVSQAAVRFWLDALIEAGAKIMPKEEEEIIELFGEKA